VRTRSHTTGTLTPDECRSPQAAGKPTAPACKPSRHVGRRTAVKSKPSHVVGRRTSAEWTSSHVVGKRTLAYWTLSHDEGKRRSACWTFSHDVGNRTSVEWTFSHDVGKRTSGEWTFSHDVGKRTSPRWTLSHDVSKRTAGRPSPLTGFPMCPSCLHLPGDRDGRLPRAEAKILALARLVTQGLREAPEDFPTPPVSADELEATTDGCDADSTRIAAAKVAFHEKPLQALGDVRDLPHVAHSRYRSPAGPLVLAHTRRSGAWGTGQARRARKTPERRLACRRSRRRPGAPDRRLDHQKVRLPRRLCSFTASGSPRACR
jgi:hypothetical protein